MATISRNPLILTTSDVSTSVPVFNGSVYINSFYWEGPAGGADTCTLKDGTYSTPTSTMTPGQVVYQGDCQNSSLSQLAPSPGDPSWVQNGLFLTAMTSGTLYVYIK